MSPAASWGRWQAETCAKMPGTDFSLHLGGDGSACLWLGQTTTDKKHHCCGSACLPLQGLDLQDVSFCGEARQKNSMRAGEAHGGKERMVTATCANPAERWAIRKRKK